MKMMIQTLAALVAILNLTGCATPYMIDRRRDAADIFSFTLGEGAGAKMRVGPVAVGLLANQDTIGFRNGCEVIMSPPSRWDVPTYDFKMLDVTFTLLGGEKADFTHGNCDDRFKSYSAITVCGISVIEPKWNDDPLVNRKAPWQSRISYYTQVEVVGGLVGTCRLGFNPGELLDFILGWTTIDIFNDDLEAKKQKQKSNHAAQATAPKVADPGR